MESERSSVPENVVADIVVVGTGFAGSILAMTLQQTGYRVVMLEKSQHPRFTIGESSTPIADMILRDLASEFNLPVLAKLSRYGTWQKHFPHLLCGIKDRKSTRLNSSHVAISYAVFCLKK